MFSTVGEKYENTKQPWASGAVQSEGGPTATAAAGEREQPAHVHTADDESFSVVCSAGLLRSPLRSRADTNHQVNEVIRGKAK